MTIDFELFSPDAVVVAAGEFPKQELMKHWIERAPFIACCDSAIGRLHVMGYKPHLLIGDGDSLSAEMATLYKDIFVKVSEQETNDLTKAVRWLNEKGKRKIVVLGGTGYREDHTLGNISLLIYYLQHGIFAIMPTDYGTFIPCHGNVSIKTAVGQQVSIFNYDATEIYSPDVKYPLPKLSMLWQGTLNEATSNVLNFTTDGYYLVYLAKDEESIN